jgi:hypothetical protein
VVVFSRPKDPWCLAGRSLLRRGFQEEWMSSATASVRVALVLGWTLGLAQLAAAQQGDGGWNQGRVTAIAEALADEMGKLDLAAAKVPPDISYSQQRAQYTLQEDIRLLKNSSRHLANQLKSGKSREETRPIVNRMQQIRASAEENARRTLIPEQLMDQILAVGGQLLQLQPYYREPEPKPKSEPEPEPEPMAEQQG